MGQILSLSERTVAVLLALMYFCLTSAGRAENASSLLQRLALADAAEAVRIEQRLTQLWSRSGSASSDLLLQRGKKALEVGKITVAIEHFTALTDHAPDFAEGWHYRGQAYAMVDLLGPAVADLERSLALNPSHFGSLRGLATIFERLNMPSNALDAYEAFLMIHPSNRKVRSARDRVQQTLRGTRI